MVSAEPAPPVGGATSDTGSEITRPLRLLRHHGQQHSVAAIPRRSGPYLGEMVGTPTKAWLPLLGRDESAAGALCAARRHRGSLGVPSGKRTHDLTSRM